VTVRPTFCSLSVVTSLLKQNSPVYPNGSETTAYLKLIRCFMLLFRVCFLPGAPESRLPRLPRHRLPHLPAVLFLPGSLPFSHILYHVTLPSGTDTHKSYIVGGCNLKVTLAQDLFCSSLNRNASLSF